MQQNLILWWIHNKNGQVYLFTVHISQSRAISVVFNRNKGKHCNEIDLAVWDFVLLILNDYWYRSSRSHQAVNWQMNMLPFDKGKIHVLSDKSVKMDLIILIRQKHRRNHLPSLLFCFISNCLLSFAKRIRWTLPSVTERKALSSKHVMWLPTYMTLAG